MVIKQYEYTNTINEMLFYAFTNKDQPDV